MADEIVNVRTMRAWGIRKWNTIQTRIKGRQGEILGSEVTDVHALTG